MRSFSFKGLFKVIIFFIILSIPYPLYSQADVEKATRETDVLGREIEEKLKPLPPPRPAKVAKPQEAPVKKEEEKFFIKMIKLVGCESFAAQDFAEIIQEYENKELTLSELNALAKKIEREYLRKGVISAVFVPPQEIKEGVVVLRVVEARMGDLQIQEHRYFKKQRLAYYWQIPQGEILRYDKISKSLQMMNRNPDREVKAALHAGKKPGTTDALLTATTHFPIHLTATYDKEGTVSTGKSRIGYGMRDNNFLGFDDTLISGYSFGHAFDGIYAYHILPVNFSGTSLMYGYSRSKSVPKKEFASSNIVSEMKTESLSLNQDLYNKEGKYAGNVFLGFDAKDKTIKQSSGTTNRDKLRIFSLGGNFMQQGLGSTTTFTPEISQGIDDFGASSRSNALISRGAKSRFSKFNLGIQHKRIMPLQTQLALKFNTQFASTKLTPQEEFSLGGIDSVRGYPSGDYLADNAIATSAELLIPSFFIPASWRLPYDKETLKNETTAVVFADYGYGERRGALPTEEKRVNFCGLGAGLRIKFFDQALLRLEWGFPVGDNTVTEAGKSRFHFSVAFQDKFPEEFERIRKLLEEESIRQRAWQIVNEELARLESPIRQRLSNYLSLAKASYKQGELKESKEFYEKISQISKSLYRQAENYVRICLSQQKELKEYGKLALGFYKEGKLTQAKDLWQKIISEAKPKSLVFEY